jgi:hypothetical protein
MAVPMTLELSVNAASIARRGYMQQACMRQ